MKKTIILLFAFIITIAVNSQTIYSKTYGNSKDKAIIFLHGGPGYNSVGFEVTTAQKLSENGFYVIVYDRRGEGRSVDNNAQFNFNESFKDINVLYKKYNIKKAVLLGHSFGGVIASLYTEKYPKKVSSLILTSAPVSLPETFKTILKSSKEIYQNKNDTTNLNYVKLLEKMDNSSLQYSSYCFAHAMQNGFYSPKKPTKEATAIYSTFTTNTLLKKYGSKMTYEPPQGFWENENYTSIDLTSNLKNIQKNKTLIYGVYGKEDGLYSENQIDKLEALIGTNNTLYLDNCSHNVFIDQQSLFIQALVNWSNIK